MGIRQKGKHGEQAFSFGRNAGLSELSLRRLADEVLRELDKGGARHAAEMRAKKWVDSKVAEMISG